MKKVLLGLFITLVLVFSFISCDDSSNNGNSIKVVVPTAPDNKSKGLFNMPTGTGEFFYSGNPLQDLEYAEAVMQCMPLFPALKTINATNSVSDSLIADMRFSIYGFDIEPVKDKCKINTDGLYVYYNIYEKDNPDSVGAVEYYYTFDGRITYRQYVMLTLTIMPADAMFSGSPLFVNNGVLIFSLEDVQLGADNSFSANQLKSGELTGLETEQAFVDYFMIGDNMGGIGDPTHPTAAYATYPPRFERRVVTMKSDGNGITSTFVQSQSSIRTNGNTKWNELTTPSPLKDLIVSTLSLNGAQTPNDSINDSYIAFSEDARKNFTGETALSFINLLYPNGAQAGIGGWTNYEAFKDASLLEYNLPAWLGDEHDFEYFFATGTGASVYKMWASYLDYSNPGDRFFLANHELSTLGVTWGDLLENHFKKCLDDNGYRSSFITNFITHVSDFDNSTT